MSSHPLTGVRLSLVCLLLLPLLLCLEQPLRASEFADPRIDFSETFFHFGFVPAGTVARHDYWIYNRGANSLAIAEVKANCSCTRYDLGRPIIAPGDSTKLTVYFDAERMFNRVIKKLAITSNDPDNPLDTIRFGATVNKEHELIKVEPRSVDFSKEALRQPKPAFSFIISNDSEEQVDVGVIAAPSEEFEVLLSRSRLRPNSRTKVDVRLINLPEEGGLLNTSVTLQFETEEPFRITIPISARIESSR